MCGRTAQGMAPARIRQQLASTLPSQPAESWIDEDKYRTSYNVAPTRYQPVVRADPKTNSYVVHMMRWGLIPRHTKSMPDYSSVLKSINARDDSLFSGPTEKPMFNHSKNHKRCILLAEGFYEWRRRGKTVTPFYTKRRDGKLMLMAAIYDVAHIQGAEEPLYTYATITTNASPQLDWLHDRMPVLIPNDDMDKIRLWLDPTVSWNSALQAMLRPCDEFMDIETVDEKTGQPSKQHVYALDTYQVDEKVNSVRNDSPDFTIPWNSISNKKTLNWFFFPKSESTATATVKSSNSSPPSPSPPASQARSPLVPSEVSSGAHRAIKSEEDDNMAKDISWEDEEESDLLPKELFQEPPTTPSSVSGILASHAEQAPDTSLEGKGLEGVEDDEDKELALALELSKREHEEQQERYWEQLTDTSDNAPPDNAPPAPQQAPKHSSVSSPSIHTDVNASAPRKTPNMFVVKKDGETVDLLERRRQEQREEEEQMRKVLELSMLDAITDGHESVAPEQSIPADELNLDIERREQEEMDRAIANSLAEEEGSLLSSQHSTGSASSGSLLASPSQSSHSKRAMASPSTPTTRKKRRESGAKSPSLSVAAVKKDKPSQTAKITSFFQHVNHPS
ncbi:hypothetical protein BGZ94_003953 [Podila epigama]|nr:hypothetical protein BGZ94_003953 [Podila epigama]